MLQCESQTAHYFSPNSVSNMSGDREKYRRVSFSNVSFSPETSNLLS